MLGMSVLGGGGLYAGGGSMLEVTCSMSSCRLGLYAEGGGSMLEVTCSMSSCRGGLYAGGGDLCSR